MFDAGWPQRARPWRTHPRRKHDRHPDQAGIQRRDVGGILGGPGCVASRATSSPTTSSATGRAIPKPVRGRAAYVGKIAELVTAAPDLALELVDSATVDGSPPGEQLVYLHYVGRGTGPDGPFAIRGLDRVRTRDGIVVENVIRYDQVELASI